MNFALVHLIKEGKNIIMLAQRTCMVCGILFEDDQTSHDSHHKKNFGGQRRSLNTATGHCCIIGNGEQKKKANFSISLIVEYFNLTLHFNLHEYIIYKDIA